MGLKELQSLLRLLRAQGVAEYSTPELTLKLRDEAPRRKRKDGSAPANPPSEDAVSEEAALFWSTNPPTE